MYNKSTQKYFIKLLSLLALSPVLLLIGCGNWSGNTSFRAKYKALLALSRGRQSNNPGPFGGNPIAPDLIYIPGGILRLGDGSEGTARQVTVAAFGISRYPVTNGEYRAYLEDLRTHASEEAYEKALPNSKVWEADLEYSGNQKNMLWYRDFDNYPVTGVSPAQAMAYCRWKTEKMQKIYFEDYFDEEDEEQEVNRKNSSEAVDNEQSESESDQLKDEKHEHDEHGGLSDRKMRKRATKLGFPMPEYRLPTEAELMHAAVGRTVDNEDNLEVEARVYPWGNSLRDEHGEFIPRIKRGPGNYGGATGESDSHGGPYEVDDGYFNDFGLRIGDNVRAISGDIYRDASFEDVSDLNPMRKDGALDPAKDYDAQPYSVDEYYVVKFASFMTGPREVTHREKAHVLHGARRDLGFWIAMTPVGPGMRRER